MAEHTEKSQRALAPIDPFDELDTLERLSPFREFGFPSRLARLLDDVWGQRPAQRGRLAPAVDICEGDGQFVVTVELPGTKREDITVESHENVLTIRGEKRSEREEKKEQSRWTERTYGAFSRSFTLPATADGDRVNASFKEGILTIEIPKIEEVKPKVVSIKS
jgi:HSP20 family protein